MTRTALLCLLVLACRGRFDELADDGGGVTRPPDAAGDPSAAKLVTKHVYGAPGGSFTIMVSGGTPTDMELRFIDAAHQRVHVSPVAADGSVTLPAKAGLYSVELHDGRTGGHSYGAATITQPVTSFAPYQEMALDSQGPYAPQWPNVAMVPADVDGDGHDDLVRSTGKDPLGALDGAGLYVQRWSQAQAQLQVPTLVPLPGVRSCGIAVFDDDADSDLDIIVVGERVATYALELCIARNAGDGTFADPACTTVDQGSAQDFAACGGGMQAGDFDRDGRIDLAFVGARHSTTQALARELRLLRNTADGFVEAWSWRADSATGFEASGIGDVNDDGRLDVLANGDQPARLHIFLATDDFMFADPIRLTSAHGDFPYDSIVPAYIDGNASLDVILVHPDGPSSLFVSDGQTLTPTSIPTFSEQHGSRFHVLDLDIDGELDIIIPYKNRYLAMDRAGAMRKTAANLTQAATPNASNTIYGVTPEPSWTIANFRFADWDRDGWLDTAMMVAYTNPKNLEVLRGN